NFFVHEARTVEFADRIRDLGIGWWGESRIDTLLRYRPASWRAMAESGLRMVFMGAESGSDETLKRMNKGGTATAGKTPEVGGLVGILAAARREAPLGPHGLADPCPPVRASAERVLPDGDQRTAAARPGLLDPAHLQFLALPPASLRPPSRASGAGEGDRLS